MHAFMIFNQRIQSRFQDERGANLVEYGLLAVLIAVVCIAGVTIVGTTTSSNISGIASAL